MKSIKFISYFSGIVAFFNVLSGYEMGVENWTIAIPIIAFTLFLDVILTRMWFSGFKYMLKEALNESRDEFKRVFKEPEDSRGYS